MFVPTKSEKPTVTTPAVPASDPFSNPPPETSKAQAPSPQPTTPASPPSQDPAEDPPSDPAGQAPKETPKTVRRSGGNVWPLLASAFDFDEPDNTDALSVLRSAQASAEAARFAASLVADAAKHPPAGSQDNFEPAENDRPGDSSHPEVLGGLSEPVEPGHSTGADLTDNSNDPIDKADDGSLRFDQLGVVWTQGSEIFTAVRADSSIVVKGAGAVATIAAGTEGTLNGQVMSIPLEGDSVKVNEAVLDFSPLETAGGGEEANKQAAAVFTEAGQAFTAEVQGSSIVLQADGAATTMALRAEGTFAGQTVSLPSTGGNVIEVNGDLITMQALEAPSNAKTPASAVWTQGGETFTAKIQSDSAILLEAPSITMLMTAGSAITLGGIVFSVPAAGDVLVHDGTSITLDRAAPTDPAEASAALEEDETRISAFDAGSSVVLVAGIRTVTLADGAQTTLDDHTISAGATGGVVVVDGTKTRTLGVHSNTAPPPESRTSGDTEECHGNDRRPQRRFCDIFVDAYCHPPGSSRSRGSRMDLNGAL